MAGPFDYSTNFNPAANIMAGVNTGINLAAARQSQELQNANIGLATQKQALEAQKFQAEQAATVAYQAKLKEVLDNPNATARDYTELAAMAPKGQQEVITKGWESVSSERKKNTLRNAGEVLSFIVNGKPELATGRLDELAEAAETSGSKEDAAFYRNYSRAVKENPEAAMKTTSIALASLDGGKELLESVYAANKEARESAETKREPQPTASIQEYKFAKENGYTGSFLEFKKALSEAESRGPNVPPPNLQKGEAYPVRDESGAFKLITPVFDPATGAVTMKETPITGTPISKLGETAAERQQREIETAGGKTGATEAEKRTQGIITAGLEAADSTANTRRALQLVKIVKTSGLRSAALSAKRFFGFDAADEGELYNKLGKAVVAQIRPTFGAQPSAKEGQWLKDMEATFGSSPAANERLLNQALQLAERAAKRGITAARVRGDKEAAQMIQEALDFELEEFAPEAEPTAAPATGERKFTVIRKVR